MTKTKLCDTIYLCHLIKNSSKIGRRLNQVNQFVQVPHTSTQHIAVFIVGDFIPSCRWLETHVLCPMQLKHKRIKQYRRKEVQHFNGMNLIPSTCERTRENNYCNLISFKVFLHPIAIANIFPHLIDVMSTLSTEDIGHIGRNSSISAISRRCSDFHNHSIAIASLATQTEKDRLHKLLLSRRRFQFSLWHCFYFVVTFFSMFQLKISLQKTDAMKSLVD